MSIRNISVIKSHVNGMFSVKNILQDVAEKWLTRLPIFNVEDMPMKSAYKQVLKSAYLMAIRSA